jgi:glycosyltransferase involved in cell wall biosynthesis
MRRILYIGPTKKIDFLGGVKVMCRHVEALTERGFDAYIHLNDASLRPDWFKTTARFSVRTSFSPSDIIVLHDDNPGILKQLATWPNDKVVFCQNHYYASEFGLGQLSPDERLAYRDFLACSATVASWLRRRFPHARVEVVPAFCDDRVFRHSAAKSDVIACAPKKRRFEASFIRREFEAGPASSGWSWDVLDGVPEERMAAGFARAKVFLSLSRHEGLGMTPLEAMSCGCIVAGYTGVGGREYATSENGFWAADDDPEAAVVALERAASLARGGGPALDAMVENAKATARAWSYAPFVDALSAFWGERARS